MYTCFILIYAAFCRDSSAGTHVWITPSTYLFLTYFFAITCALMAVYVTSPEAVWALRPRGSPPLCPPELRARLVSFGLWTPTRLIYSTTGWRPVPRRGCRAGRRVCKQRLTSLSVSTLGSCREWQIPVIVGRRLSAEFAACSTTTRRRRRQSPSRRSALRAVLNTALSTRSARAEFVRHTVAWCRRTRAVSVCTERGGAVQALRHRNVDNRS